MFLGQWWEESVFEKHRAPHRWPTTARSKTARDTAPRPGPIHDRKRPRPGTQDTRARPTRSTEQQDEQPETHSQNRPRRARQSSSPPPEQPRAPPSTGQDPPPAACRHRLLQPVSCTTGSGRGHTGTGLEVHPGHRRAPGAAT